MTHEEYISDLQIALIQAALSWKKDGGASFASYAYNGLMFARRACYWRTVALEARETCSLEAEMLRCFDDPTRPHPLKVCYRDELADGEEFDKLCALVQRLPKRHQRIIRLRYKGMTFADIGRRLRISRQAAQQSCATAAKCIELTIAGDSGAIERRLKSFLKEK